MEGWITLQRRLLDNPIWTCEPFTRGQAWVDLLFLANYEFSFFYKRGVKIEVQIGQVARSEVELADRWMWSRTKVRKFLKDLEKEQQVIQHKNNVTQILTIVNYEKYQNKEQQTVQQKNSRKTPKEQQKNTLKEYKEDKQIKEEYKNNMCAEKSEKELEFERFNKWIDDNIPELRKIKNQITIGEYFRIRNKYTGDQIRTVLSSIANYKEADKKYISVNLTFLKWVKREYNQ